MPVKLYLSGHCCIEGKWAASQPPQTLWNATRMSVRLRLSMAGVHIPTHTRRCSGTLLPCPLVELHETSNGTACNRSMTSGRSEKVRYRRGFHTWHMQPLPGTAAGLILLLSLSAFLDFAVACERRRLGNRTNDSPSTTSCGTSLYQRPRLGGT